MSLSNILSLFFGELESSVVVTLGFAHILIVSLIVLYKEKLTKTANAEPQILLTPPSTGPSNELNTVEVNLNSLHLMLYSCRNFEKVLESTV